MPDNKKKYVWVISHYAEDEEYPVAVEYASNVRKAQDIVLATIRRFEMTGTGARGPMWDWTDDHTSCQVSHLGWLFAWIKREEVQ